MHLEELLNHFLLERENKSGYMIALQNINHYGIVKLYIIINAWIILGVYNSSLQPRKETKGKSQRLKHSKPSEAKANTTAMLRVQADLEP
jgi:hypothetical protein